MTQMNTAPATTPPRGRAAAEARARAAQVPVPAAAVPEPVRPKPAPKTKVALPLTEAARTKAIEAELMKDYGEDAVVAYQSLDRSIGQGAKAEIMNRFSAGKVLAPLYEKYSRDKKQEALFKRFAAIFGTEDRTLRDFVQFATNISQGEVERYIAESVSKPSYSVLRVVFTATGHLQTAKDMLWKEVCPGGMSSETFKKRLDSVTKLALPDSGVEEGARTAPRSFSGTLKQFQKKVTSASATVESEEWQDGLTGFLATDPALIQPADRELMVATAETLEAAVELFLEQAKALRAVAERQAGDADEEALEIEDDADAPPELSAAAPADDEEALDIEEIEIEEIEVEEFAADGGDVI